MERDHEAQQTVSQILLEEFFKSKSSFLMLGYSRINVDSSDQKDKNHAMQTWVQEWGDLCMTQKQQFQS